MADQNSGSNTQIVTVGQNIVVAIGEMTKAINSTFPNWQGVPANSSASGVAGQVAFSGGATTSSYLYVCLVSGSTGNGVWGRTLLTTSF